MLKTFNYLNSFCNDIECIKSNLSKNAYPFSIILKVNYSEESRLYDMLAMCGKMFAGPRMKKWKCFYTQGVQIIPSKE